MGPSGTRAIVLDAGGLIAIERALPRIRAVLDVAAQASIPIYVPSAVVAEVWRGGGGRQARLAAFFQSGTRGDRVRVIALDFANAKLVGILVGRAKAERISVADAMSAWCALHVDGVVYTSDPDDLGRVLPADRVRTI